MMTDDLTLLFLGRVCGGIGTTLLYTSFESWMLTEYGRCDMRSAGLSTATIFSTQTTLNSVAAIASGIVGEALVAVTGSRKSPFLFAGFVSVAAGCWMMLYWVSYCLVPMI